MELPQAPQAPIEVSKALTLALKASGLRDEEAAVRANVSVWTIQNIRAGRTKKPTRLVLEALKRAVPGFEELLAGRVVA